MNMTAKDALFVALGIFTLIYLTVLLYGIRRVREAPVRSEGDTPVPTGKGLITGFITNFFDTLGIGSFATTTSFFKFWKMGVPDERIPGTLNVGHTLPAIAQAFIYTRIVPVESRTLILMILAAVTGAWLGAGVVSTWSRRKVQIGMGICLLGAATLMLLSQLKLVPGGGEALGLSGGLLVAAIAGNFLLGALMTLGIGLYAPCLILISMLGMNPTAGFPIMMGSCAFLMPISSARFIQKRGFDLRASIGLLIGGLPAVLIAAFIVKALPLSAVRWLVVIIVVYTAWTLLRAAQRERSGTATPIPAGEGAAVG